MTNIINRYDVDYMYFRIFFNIYLIFLSKRSCTQKKFFDTFSHVFLQAQK